MVAASPLPHGGTGAKYAHEGCRCAECRAAHGARVKRRRDERAKLIVADPSLAPHGTVSTYNNWGCRCDQCRAVHTARCARDRVLRLARQAAVA